MRPKTTLSALAAISLALVAGAACAGPDWTTIEQGRADKLALQSSTGKVGASTTLTLQNYGPRPQYVLQKSAEKSRAGTVIVAK